MRDVVLYQREAVDVLPCLPARSVDMVYLDPPFLTQKHWTGKAGAFSDKWSWGAAAVADLAALEVLAPAAAAFVGTLFGQTATGAYYAAMARLLAECRGVLALTGSLWLHADDTAIHGLRVVGDAIFGPAHALGTVVWRRTSAHSMENQRGFGRVHDTIAAWARSRAARWRLARIRGGLTHGTPEAGLFVDGVVEHIPVPASERVGYPTQKPVALIRRFVECATLEGDTVLDPVMGSGTTLVAAREAKCRAIGIDRSPDAIRVASERLDVFPQPMFEAA